MINEKLITILSEMAILHDMKDEFFPARAYDRAVDALGVLGEDLRVIYKRDGLKGLQEIEGIGKGIALKIEQFLNTKKIDEYDKLKKEIPVDVLALTALEGIGPKTVKKLYEVRDIKTVDELQKAALRGYLKGIPGMGEKTIAKIIKSIRFGKNQSGRFLLSEALPMAEKVVKDLSKITGVSKVQHAGSVRRMQETVGDLDILVVSSTPKKIMEHVVKMDDVDEIIVSGPTKTSLRLHNGIQTDIRVISPESYGAAIQYFTGDKHHNVELRALAVKKGYSLNEYGLKKGKKIVASKTEEEIYEKLGLKYIEPELRTNTGEIEAASKDELPDLIGYDDMKGDLQIQTDWTDGSSSIEDCVKAARKRGLEYIVITDHTKTLAMTGGSDEKKLLKQMAEIDKIQKKFSDIKILKGAEVNILKDGSLDIDDETLAKLDVVGAAVHTLMNLPEKDQTKRICTAMKNPNLDILFHPTGRRILRREPYSVDMDQIIKTAKQTKTIMEIDAHPERLDLKDVHIRKALKEGIMFSIDSDAHHADGVGVLQYGIGQARRGWASKEDIINTKPLEEMLSFLK